ncbi:MAG: hypothetical protein WBQ86_12640, partial [Candidatus Binatus sp.]
MSELFQLDAPNARTTYATTGKRWITDRQMGVADGATLTFSGTFTQVPIQPGSLIIACGTKVSSNSLTQHNRKKGATVIVLDFISDDGQGNIKGPSVASGTIDYATGDWTLTFTTGQPPLVGDDPTADFVQLLTTPGAGRCLALLAGGVFASKSIPTRILPSEVDVSTGQQVVIKLTVSGWYKASAATTAGIRIRVMFANVEDFLETDPTVTGSIDIIADGPATTAWQQFSQTVNVPTPLNKNSWTRVIAYHNATDTTGATVYYDDFSVKPDDQGITATEWLVNPSFDFPGRITSNPSSIYRDILQGSANKKPVADSRLDLTMLETWWTECEMASRFFNGIFDQPATVFEQIAAVTPLGRASYQLRDGLFSVARDVPQSAIARDFTPRNSWAFKGTMPFIDLPQTLRVRWTNPELNYQPDERLVYDDMPGGGAYDAFSLPVNPLYETLDLSNSVTDIDQAWREGRFHLAQGRLRQPTYELTCDMENLRIQRGDLIRVSHDMLIQGLGWGRVKSVELDGSSNCLGVTLDEPSLMMNYGSAYALRIRKVTDGSASLLENVTNSAAAIAPTLSSATSAAWATARVAIAGYGAPPTVRSSAVGPAGTAMTAAVTMAAGSLAGELLIVQLGFDANPGAITPPDGWNLLVQVSDPGNTTYAALFYKLSNGAEPGTYAFDWANSVAFESGSVCVTGNAGASPIDASASLGFAAMTTAAAPYPAPRDPSLDLILVFATQNAAATLALAGATTLYAPAASGFGCWSHATPFSGGGAFTFATPIPSGDPQPQIGDLAMFGLQGSESGIYLVTKIEPGPDLSAILTFVDYV